MHRLKVGLSDGTMLSIRHVNEYPTMHEFKIPKYTRSKIAYKVLTEYLWKFQCKITVWEFLFLTIQSLFLG